MMIDIFFKKIFRNYLVFTAREWIGSHTPNRAVALVINDDKKSLEIRTHAGNLLRNIDLTRRTSIDVILVNDGKHLVLKNPNEFDCVLEFGSSFLRDTFYSLFEQRYVVICLMSEMKCDF